MVREMLGKKIDKVIDLILVEAIYWENKGNKQYADTSLSHAIDWENIKATLNNQNMDMLNMINSSLNREIEFRTDRNFSFSL
jgi:predicted transglutaminase-like cysteine proteinase